MRLLVVGLVLSVVAPARAQRSEPSTDHVMVAPPDGGRRWYDLRDPNDVPVGGTDIDADGVEEGAAESTDLCAHPPPFFFPELGAPHRHGEVVARGSFGLTRDAAVTALGARGAVPLTQSWSLTFGALGGAAFDRSVAFPRVVANLGFVGTTECGGARLELEASYASGAIGTLGLDQYAASMRGTLAAGVDEDVYWLAMSAWTTIAGRARIVVRSQQAPIGSGWYFGGFFDFQLTAGYGLSATAFGQQEGVLGGARLETGVSFGDARMALRFGGRFRLGWGTLWPTTLVFPVTYAGFVRLAFTSFSLDLEMGAVADLLAKQYDRWPFGGVRLTLYFE